MTGERDDLARLLAGHRLTFWTVYQWQGGYEVAPRCTCGVLWSAGNRDDPNAQIAHWETHLADVLAAHLAERDERVRRETVRDAADAWCDYLDLTPGDVPSGYEVGDWLRGWVEGLG